jgi:hypothetical protein
MLLQVSHHLVVLLLRDFASGVSLAEYLTGVPIVIPVATSPSPSPAPGPEDESTHCEDDEEYEEEAEWEEEPAKVRIAVVGRRWRVWVTVSCQSYDERYDCDEDNARDNPAEYAVSTKVHVAVISLRLISPPGVLGNKVVLRISENRITSTRHHLYKYRLSEFPRVAVSLCYARKARASYDGRFTAFVLAEKRR